MCVLGRFGKKWSTVWWWMGFGNFHIIFTHAFWNASLKAPVEILKPKIQLVVWNENPTCLERGTYIWFKMCEVQRLSPYALATHVECLYYGGKTTKTLWAGGSTSEWPIPQKLVWLGRWLDDRWMRPFFIHGWKWLNNMPF